MYLANQRNEMENNLSLEDVEAEGTSWFIEGLKIVWKYGKYVIEATGAVWTGYEIYDEITEKLNGAVGDYCGRVLTKEINGRKFYQNKYFCMFKEGADACQPGTYVFGAEYGE